jgi:hypothetical protein
VLGVLEFYSGAEWDLFEVRYVRKHDGVQLTCGNALHYTVSMSDSRVPSVTVTSSSPLLTSMVSSGELGVSCALLPTIAAERHDHGHVVRWRESVTASLRKWLDADKSLSQRDFWKLFKTLQGEQTNPAELAKVLDFDCPSEFTFVQYAAGCGKTRSLATYFARKLSHEQLHDNIVLVDGQHRIFIEPKITIDLSARLIERIIRRTIFEIESRDDIDCLASLFGVFDASLSQSVAKEARFVLLFSHDSPDRLNVKTTRDDLMNFRIRTGNPPPAGCRTWAAVSCPRATSIVERQEDEQVQKPKSARRLRKSFCARRARSYLNRCSQNDPRAHRGAQLARRRHSWPYYLLEKGPRRVRPLSQWKMARSVSVER